GRENSRRSERNDPRRKSDEAAETLIARQHVAEGIVGERCWRPSATEIQHCSLNEEFLATNYADYADYADFNPFNPRNLWLKNYWPRCVHNRPRQTDVYTGHFGWFLPRFE